MRWCIQITLHTPISSITCFVRHSSMNWNTHGQTGTLAPYPSKQPANNPSRFGGVLYRVLIGRIQWDYIAEKAAATLGSIGLMIVITEHYVLPVVQPILPSQTDGMLFSQKVGELGWVLLDMVFPYPTPAPHPSVVCLVLIGGIGSSRCIYLRSTSFSSVC